MIRSNDENTRRSRIAELKRRAALSEARNSSLNNKINYIDFVRNYKKRTGKTVLTEADRAMLHRRFNRLNESTKPLNDLNIVIANYKKVKEAKLGTSKVTYKEIKTLRDAVNRANRFGRKLKEADPNMLAQDPNAEAGTSTDAGAISPDIQSQIQTLLQQVQNLATSAGVQLNDLGANAQADIPPVAGTQPVVDAAAQPQQPVMEAVNKIRAANNGKCNEADFMKVRESFKKDLIGKFGVTKDRIAVRSAKLDCMNESYDGDFASAYFKSIGLKEAASPIEGVPTESAVAKGTVDAKGKLASELHTPVAWPDHQISGAALQGEGAKQQKVKESVSSNVDDTYVENFYADKLSFDKIRESMKSGVLA